MVAEEPLLGLLAPHDARGNDADETGEVPPVRLGVEGGEDGLGEGVTYDSGVVGPVIDAVGLIGVGDIATDGYATITPTYFINPDHASFCGTLNLIGNLATLTNLYANGARKYQVSHRYGATASSGRCRHSQPHPAIVGQSQVIGVNDVWQSFGPDANGYYPLVSPTLVYTIQNLLFQWTTMAEPDGVHQFQISFFDVNNHAVALPTGLTPQWLTLALDNQPPTVDLIKQYDAMSCTLVSTFGLRCPLYRFTGRTRLRLFCQDRWNCENFVQ